jgi:drug/metabolite transporter (DMT)-like permease
LQLRVFVVLAVAILAISCAAVLIRLAQAEGVGPLAIAAWRLGLASLLWVPCAFALEPHSTAQLMRHKAKSLGLAGLFLALHFSSWVASLQFTSVASSVVLVTTGPVFAALGSWLVLGERPQRRLWLGIGAALCGTVLIGWADLNRSEFGLSGDLLALTGAVMMAGYLLVGRRLRQQHSTLAYTAPVYLVSAALLWLFALVREERLFGLSGRAYAWLLAMAVIPQLIGHTGLNWALRHLSATYVALSTMLEPVGASLLALLILDEPVPPLTGLGGLFILLGVYIATGESRHPRPATQAEARTKR